MDVIGVEMVCACGDRWAVPWRWTSPTSVVVNVPDTGSHPGCPRALDTVRAEIVYRDVIPAAPRLSKGHARTSGN